MMRVFSLGLALLSLLSSLEYTQAEPARFALVVGVREYPVSEKLPNLTYTEADATKLAGTLKSAGYDVTLMTKTASSGNGNERFNPTAALIRKQFGDIVETPFLKKEDCVLVILEGHGIQLPSRTNPRNVTFYFCASDSSIDKLKFSEDVDKGHNLIAVQELYDTLNKSGAGVKLLVADACRNDPNKQDVFRSGNSVTRPAVPVPTGGMAAFFSCSAGQRAVEDQTLEHGVFSYYLNEGLSGKADSDKNGDITISELQAYVGFQTFTYVRKKYSRRQTPELTGKVQGFASLLSLAKSTTPRPVIPTPMPVIPKNNKFAGSKAGDLWEMNGLAMKFRWCPPGTFTMGSPESEKDRQDDEAQVKVTLSKGFWLGQHEVTQGEWEKLMGTTPWGGEKYVKEGSNYAASDVRWDDVVKFCEKLTEQERRAGRLPADWAYSLPTEAQWEYACRAGTTTRFSFGEDLDYSKLSEYAWSRKNAYDIDEKYAHTVGQKKANAWHLYDMHGNVWEWCRDWYTDSLPGGTDPEVTQQARSRVFRGGGWYDYGRSCRSAFRFGYSPVIRNYDIGFRVALKFNPVR